MRRLAKVRRLKLNRRGGQKYVEDESEEENYIKVDTIEIKAKSSGKTRERHCASFRRRAALTSVALLFAIISNNPPAIRHFG